MGNLPSSSVASTTVFLSDVSAQKIDRLTNPDMYLAFPEQFKDAKTPHGDYALHIAAGQPDAELTAQIVRLLIRSYNFPIDCRDREGNTPLHVAALKSNALVCRAITELKPVSRTIRSSSGYLAYEYAKTPELQTLLTPPSVSSHSGLPPPAHFQSTSTVQPPIVAQNTLNNAQSNLNNAQSTLNNAQSNLNHSSLPEQPPPPPPVTPDPPTPPQPQPTQPENHSIDFPAVPTALPIITSTSPPSSTSSTPSSTPSSTSTSTPTPTRSVSRPSRTLSKRPPVAYPTGQLPPAPSDAPIDVQALEAELRKGRSRDAELSSAERAAKRSTSIRLGDMFRLANSLLNSPAPSPSVSTDADPAAIVAQLRAAHARVPTDPVLPLLIEQGVAFAEVERLLAQGTSQANAYNFDQSSTPLLAAVLRGDAQLVRLLIARGADVNLPELHGLQSPLHAACYGGHIECLRALLEAGADVHAVDAEGATPLIDAITQDLDFVELLAAYGANVNAHTFDRRSPLMYATVQGDLPTLEFLIADGAELDFADEDGMGPLQLALTADAQVLPRVRLLVEAGASVAAQANDGSTVLHEAARGGDLELLQYLINNGAPLHVKDAQGYTPRMVALYSGAGFKIVNFLTAAERVQQHAIILACDLFPRSSAFLASLRSALSALAGSAVQAHKLLFEASRLLQNLHEAPLDALLLRAWLLAKSSRVQAHPQIADKEAASLTGLLGLIDDVSSQCQAEENKLIEACHLLNAEFGRLSADGSHDPAAITQARADLQSNKILTGDLVMCVQFLADHKEFLAQRFEAAQEELAQSSAALQDVHETTRETAQDLFSAALAKYRQKFDASLSDAPPPTGSAVHSDLELKRNRFAVVLLHHRIRQIEAWARFFGFSVEQPLAPAAEFQGALDAALALEAESLQRARHALQQNPAFDGIVAKVRTSNAGLASEHAAPLLEMLRCPLTQEPMVSPVIFGDGHSYEEDALNLWLQIQPQSSPLTLETFTQPYFPNHMWIELRTFILK